MTYKEIAERLNNLYSTKIFETEYNGDVGESSSIWLDVGTKIGKPLSVEVNPTTYEIGSVVIHKLSVKDIETLSNADSNLYKKVQNLSLELANEKENVEYWRNKNNENNAVKEFAQDTILKAIEG